MRIKLFCRGHGDLHFRQVLPQTSTRGSPGFNVGHGILVLQD